MWTVLRSFLGGLDPRTWIEIIVVVALMSAIGYLKISQATYEHLYTSEVDKVADLTTKKADLEEKIKIQNESIAQSAKDKEDLQAKLDKTQAVNVVLEQNNETYKKKLLSNPVPKDCPSSIAEIKNTMKELSTKWNKK